MTYEEFLEFIPSKCMYETVYTDSDGHPILVMRLLDAYGMANKLASVEREACAKVCDSYYESWINIHGRYEFMGEGAQECANAIRARGQA
jgi:hypothetical protein